MAQDLIFIPLNDDVPQDFDRKLVIDILSKGATIRGHECLYTDGSRGEASGIDDASQERLKGLGFTHFGGRMLMECIYELADALDVFLWWSFAGDGEPCACVTRAERLDRLRDEAKMFDVAVARDASHLNLLVKDATFEDNGW